MNLLLELFLTFAKIGLFTFGGGYAMISMIENACVENKNWISHDDMMNITVIAESTPGPIAINCATFVGYKQKGLIGAVAATLGIVMPSFVIIYLIALLLDNFLEITIIANAFKGIKLAVGILILDAAVKMIKKMPKKAAPRTIMVCAAVLMMVINIFSLNFTSVSIMLAAGIISLCIFVMKGGKEGKAK
jgi:chromate transporter